MNRLGFLKKLGQVAILSVMARPIVEALVEADTITTGEWITLQVDGFTVHFRPLPIFDITTNSGSPLESFGMYGVDEKGELYKMTKSKTE